MMIVKDPITLKVTFDGTCICTEGKFCYTFAISTKEFFDEERNTELPTELLKAARLSKSMYRVEKIECSYGELSWEIEL